MLRQCLGNGWTNLDASFSDTMRIKKYIYIYTMEFLSFHRTNEMDLKYSLVIKVLKN